MGIIQVFLICELVTPVLSFNVISERKCSVYNTFLHTYNLKKSILFEKIISLWIKQFILSERSNLGEHVATSSRKDDSRFTEPTGCQYH